MAFWKSIKDEPKLIFYLHYLNSHHSQLLQSSFKPGKLSDKGFLALDCSCKMYIIELTFIKKINLQGSQLKLIYPFVKERLTMLDKVSSFFFFLSLTLSFQLLEWNQEPTSVVFKENPNLFATIFDFLDNGWLDSKEAQNNFHSMASSLTLQTVQTFIDQIKLLVEPFRQGELSISKKRRHSLPPPFPSSVKESLHFSDLQVIV